ncbi:MAG: metallophosphoesterase [Conexivisphaerales archaeon]
MTKTRMLFASDFHGNDTVWRKFLNSAKIFSCNVLLCGGDMTGKVMVPIVRHSDGSYTATLMEQRYRITESDLQAFKHEVRKYSYVPYVCSEEEYQRLSDHPDEVEKVFEKVEAESLKEWMDIIPQKVGKDVRVIMNAGNDDKLSLDQVLRSHPNVIYADEEVIDLDDKHEMACFSWSNPTPWNSPREAPEEVLEERLEKILANVKNMKNAIFAFHVPPYDSQIDRAPKLDENFNVVVQGGRPVMIPVGSKAVRKMIEKYQPLIGLHGHIHESPGMYKIGRTVCVNPGSEYAEGLLKAFLIDFEDGKISRLQRIEG